MSEGINPVEYYKKLEQERYRERENSFEAIAREWHKNNSQRWTASNASRILKSLEHDIFPVIGHMPINDITAPQLLQVVQDIQNRGANEIAKRNLQNCGRIFRYGIFKGVCERDVAADIRDQLVPGQKQHYPSISVKELPEFLQTLEANRPKLYRQTYLALHLLMRTFVRPNKEFIRAEWREFDFEDAVWVIPEKRMKMKREHIVPLSRQSLEILEELWEMNGWNSYVFPGRNDPNKHMSENSILKAIYDMGYRGRMTGHGFRSLAMSVAIEKLGYRFEVPDRQLAHVPKSEIAKAYDRAAFLDDRRQMMQDWSDYLDKCMSAQFIEQKR